jgi:hypothetical protein
MSEYPEAKHAFVTEPSRGVFVLNVQNDTGSELQRWRISLAHLSNIVVDGARMALTSREAS